MASKNNKSNLDNLVADVKSGPLVTLKTEVERRDRKIKFHSAAKARLEKERKNALLALQEICKHPKEQIRHQEDYVSGNYNDTAYTCHELICTYCKKLLKKWEESHSWHG